MKEFVLKNKTPVVPPSIELTGRPPVIKTQAQFWDAMIDAKNQFLAFQYMLAGKGELPLEKLLEENRELSCLSFVDYLKNNGQTLSSQILNNKKCKWLIKLYDELIVKLKKVKTIKQYKQIMEESHEYIRKYDLGF